MICTQMIKFDILKKLVQNIKKTKLHIKSAQRSLFSILIPKPRLNSIFKNYFNQQILRKMSTQEQKHLNEKSNSKDNDTSGKQQSKKGKVVKKVEEKGGDTGQQDMIKCKTPKELKDLARPQFQANPQKFYPCDVFKKFGYHRTQCPKCKGFYWRYSESVENCGDSNCAGSYSFIGKGFNQPGKKTTYAQVYQQFAASMNKTSGTTHVDRYPVVARWRNDVDYVAAGIYLFQPYCVTGELDPPANPITQPQLCVRFNDLDNIGITGRHYSSFIMMGIHAFNYEKNTFWKDQTINGVQLWLTETLKIPPIEITWREDIWAGGGNLGPCAEFFIRGLQVGNVVFMQYKTFPDGSREELPVRVIDTGIGQERVAWVLNGTPTSYVDTFGDTFKLVVMDKLGLKFNQGIWEKFSPYSCQLDIDESQNIDSSWQKIADIIGKDVKEVKEQIGPVKDAIIILDHTRTVMMIIEDGSLPSNVGGGSNVRNILRRVFSIIQKHQWWDKIGGVPGLIEIFNSHKMELAKLYGDFKEYPSFTPIIQEEYNRWLTTDQIQMKNLKNLLQKKSKGPNQNLTIDEWIIAITSWGIPADKIAAVSKQEIPSNLYYEIAERQEGKMKPTEAILYNTVNVPQTQNLYYNDHHLYQFDAKIVDVFQNLLDKNKRNILFMNQSAFYPTSGGQMNDLGKITVKLDDGKQQVYNVINVEKTGKTVLHYLDRALQNPENSFYIGKQIHCSIDKERRYQLRWHHTATHIVFASCRKVLGPHIWQNGAKKTTHEAHIDITHFKGLSKQQEQAIQNEANRIVTQSRKINKFIAPKPEMEKKYGFSLYQGGIVPGKDLRIVQIDGVDTEACCGTHCDSTAEVGWIRMIKSGRISDGIVRLYYVAGERAIEVMNAQQNIMNDIQKIWGCQQNELVQTAKRFFDDYKRLSGQCKKQDLKILDMQMSLCLKSEPGKMTVIRSDDSNPTQYFAYLPTFSIELKEKDHGIVFVGKQFVVGLVTRKDQFDVKQSVESLIKTKIPNVGGQVKNKVSFKKPGSKKNQTADGVCFFSLTTKDVVNVDEIVMFLKDKYEAEIIG